MQAFFVYGPIVLSGVMMGIMVVTSVRVWRAHRAAMKSLSEYNAALRAATDYLRQNPRTYLDMMADMDSRRRMN